MAARTGLHRLRGGIVKALLMSALICLPMLPVAALHTQAQSKAIQRSYRSVDEVLRAVPGRPFRPVSLRQYRRIAENPNSGPVVGFFYAKDHYGISLAKPFIDAVEPYLRRIKFFAIDYNKEKRQDIVDFFSRVEFTDEQLRRNSRWIIPSVVFSKDGQKAHVTNVVPRHQGDVLHFANTYYKFWMQKITSRNFRPMRRTPKQRRDSSFEERVE